MGYYTIIDGNGNEVCDGVSAERVREVARRAADRLGEAVYVHDSEDPDGEPDVVLPSA